MRPRFTTFCIHLFDEALARLAKIHVFGGMPQPKLLKRLKLPDTPARVKLFRKIPPESIARRLSKLLLTMLRQPDGASSKLLAHLPAINLGAIEEIVANASLVPA